MKKITVPSYREDNYYDRVALNHTPTKEPPVAFLVLTFLLSVPFYILNALAYRNAVLTPTVALPAVFLFFCILAAGIFNNTGKSVFAAILFQASDNTALVTLPKVQAITPWGAVVNSSLVLVAAVVVTLLWGPGTLARFRFAN